MMKKTLFLSVLIFSSGIVFGENLVFNGDFELGCSGFTIERFQRPDTNPDVKFPPLKTDSAVRFSGRQSLRIENPYAERGIVYSREFYLKPHTTFFLRGAVKTSEAKLPIHLELITRTMAKGPYSKRGHVSAGTNWSEFEVPLNTGEFGGMYHVKVFLPTKKGTVWLDHLSVSSGGSTEFSGIEMGISADDRIYVAPTTENASITVQIYNSGKTEFRRKLRLVAVDDYSGARFPAAELDCRIKQASSRQFRFSYPLKRMGCFRIELENAGEIRCFPAYFAVVGQLERKPFDRKRYCVGFNGGLKMKGLLTDPPGVIASNASIREKLRIMSLAGCRILRGHGSGDNWYYLEPEPGKFNFKFLDFGLKLFEEYGIAYLPVVGGNCFFINTAGWAPKEYPLWFKQVARKAKTISKGGPMLIPPDAVWRRYVSNLAAHAGKRIMQYEIFNEPQFQVSAETYMEFLKSAYEEIKKANPEASVVGFCSTSDKGQDISLFTRRCFELGGLKYADAVSFHPYASRELGSVEPADKQIAAMKELIRKHGSTPLWNTELYYLFDGPEMKNYWESGKVKAHHVAWRFLTDLGEGVEQSQPLSEDQLWTELMIPGYEHITSYPDLYPSPVIPAYNALARFFEGAEPLDKIRYPEGVLCYVFRKEGKPVAAIWNYRKTRHVKIDLSGLTAYDLFGNPVKGILPLNLAPFYLQPGNLTEKQFIARLKTLPVLLEQSVTASPGARLIVSGGKTVLLVGISNQTGKTVSGFLGVNSGALSAVAPVPFTLKGHASRTMEIPVQEKKAESASVLKIYIDGKIWESPLKIHRTRIHALEKSFSLRSADGRLNAEGTVHRNGKKTVFDLHVKDATDSGVPEKWQPWEQDCVEFFFDADPDILPEHHPEAYRPGVFRLFVMPRRNRGEQLLIWKNDRNLSEQNVRSTVTPLPNGYRIRLELPENALPPRFGLEIKINDAQAGKKTEREAYLFDAKQAYQNRLSFGIIQKGNQK